MATGNTFAGGGDDEGAGLLTGDITYEGGSFAAFAGVQTATTNSGLGSVNQAATALSANANINFGAP